jgi:hypothetical protein
MRRKKFANLNLSAASGSTRSVARRIAPNGRIAALAGLALTGLACGMLFSSVRQPSQTAGSTVNDLLKGAIPDTPRML